MARRSGRASMGPTSENAGYESGGSIWSSSTTWLQWVRRPRTPVMLPIVVRGIKRRSAASMGPTSENAGYGLLRAKRRCRWPKLQWVRRPRTPVMQREAPGLVLGSVKLQWVRRPRTPVMVESVADCANFRRASMGPTSENAGYDHHIRAFRSNSKCFNGSDVRERRLCSCRSCYSPSLSNASMGPTSENAGYVPVLATTA